MDESQACTSDPRHVRVRPGEDVLVTLKHTS